MLRSTLRSCAAATLVLAPLCGTAAAQQPSVVNGQVTKVEAVVPFADAFNRLVSSVAGTGWIGYGVPVVETGRRNCCGGADGPSWSACGLESSPVPPAREPSRAASGPRTPIPVQLEGSERISILFRVVSGSLERLRVLSGECVLDAGGRPLQWVEGVPPADSVRLLESLALAHDADTRVADGAVMAIALHRDGSADSALDRLVSGDRPEGIRKKVTFWLGNARGRSGFDRLRRVLREDTSIEVRKSAVFGISQSRVPDTVDALASIARTDSEPRLRAEALFWLAQAAGRKAAAAITETIEQDPDTDVKKKAVFALSQLPKDEGVPLLITVARTNTNPAVRKQAMFWLGQSKDPRAIDFFTQVLK